MYRSLEILYMVIKRLSGVGFFDDPFVYKDSSGTL